MKDFFKKDRFKVFFYALCLVLLAVLFNKALEHFYIITNFVSKIYRLLLPFIYGFIIAYLFNPVVKFFESRISKLTYSSKKRRRYRFLSIIIGYLIFFGTVALLGSFVAPKMASSLLDLIYKLPLYVNNFRDYLFVLIDRYGFADAQGLRDTIDKYVNIFLDKYDIQNMEFYVDKITSGVINVTTSMYNVILGFIIALYFLLEKEKFTKEIKRTSKALLNYKTYDIIKRVIKDIDRIFSKFIIGKAIDSIIIGILCFIGLLLINMLLSLNIRYILLLSVIITITNMIPYFGPFIGAIPAVIITLLYDPISAIWVAIFILILQQFDGWILGPKILGDNVGMNPVWIVLAIIIGGGFFGFIGMILGVPTVGVIKLWIEKYVNRKIQEKERINKG